MARTCVLHDPHTNPRTECICPRGFNGTLGDISNPNSVCLLFSLLKWRNVRQPAEFPSYMCTCMPQYEGRHSEALYNPCTLSPCQNGGACHRSGALDYTRTCPSGFRGWNCEMNIDDCVNNLYHNGGRYQLVVIKARNMTRKRFPLEYHKELPSVVWSTTRSCHLLFGVPQGAAICCLEYHKELPSVV
ncbi:hypothetical protein ACOMHN_063502 [Nucella lapillus]